MGRSDWRPLRGIRQRRLSMTRLQAHHAAQWLARAARAYVPLQPDDGHTNLGWSNTFDGFATHLMQGGTCLSLKIADLTLVLHSDERTIQSFSLDGRTDAQARQWLGEQLGARGLDARALDASSLRTQSPKAAPMASRMWQMPWSSLLPGSPTPNIRLSASKDK